MVTRKSSETVNTQPKLWVLHNMPRSGGTLVSKCLGAMSSTVLLSEIHPDAQHAASFNALHQAQEWYGLAKELDWQKCEFIDAIKRLEQDASSSNKALILRDWSHADYLGPPVTNQPKNKPALMSVLSEYFDIRTIQLVRHPLDTWLSLRRLNLIRKHNINLSQFLVAYRHYLENTSSDYRLVYEEFLKEPSLQLKELCRRVGLPFDQTYQDRWFEFDKVTGDTSNSNSLRGIPTIEPRARRECVGIDENWLEAQDDYRHLVNELYGS